MLRSLPPTEGPRGKVDKLIAIVGSRSAAEVASHLDGLSRELAGYVADRLSALDQVVPVWAMIDRSGKSDYPPIERVTIVTVDIRVDLPADELGHNYVYAPLNLNLYLPSQFDGLRDGRDAFRLWLIEQTLRSWRRAWEKCRPSERLLAPMRAWVYGSPERRFELDDNGVVDDSAQPLPDPEKCFYDPSAMTGLPPPPDEEGQERGSS